MMVMQLMSMMPANKSAVQRESMGSMLSGIISVNQKKSINLKNSFRRLRNKLPNIATPSSRPGNQSISNQSDDNGLGCGFFNKLAPKNLFIKEE